MKNNPGDISQNIHHALLFWVSWSDWPFLEVLNEAHVGVDDYRAALVALILERERKNIWQSCIL
jgi:hypothetical protein